jgi:tetratricopeptide (TPR) repeat protein
VDLEHLQKAIRRRHSELQMAENFRRLQRENSELKTQLRSLKRSPTGVSTLTIELPGRNKTAEQAQQLVDQAITTPNLLQKIELASQAAVLDPRDADPLVVRGQTYLKLASAAYSNKAKPRDYSMYVDNARMDFDRALIIDPKNTWALLGQGDVNTWLQRHEDAGHSYAQALTLDPLFDIARHRLSTLYTAEARKLAAKDHWEPALAVLQKLLNDQVPDSWVFDHKEAYLLRSDIYTKLNQPARAIEDLSVVLRVEPADTRALLTRAKLYREHLQGHLAKSDFERACMLGSKEACRELP